jgi:hypothetical protein
LVQAIAFCLVQTIALIDLIRRILDYLVFDLIFECVLKCCCLNTR